MYNRQKCVLENKLQAVENRKCENQISEFHLINYDGRCINACQSYIKEYEYKENLHGFIDKMYVEDDYVLYHTGTEELVSQERMNVFCLLF